MMYHAPKVTGEIRIKHEDHEEVYKILQIGRMDVRHDMVYCEGWDGNRQFIDVGRSRVTFDHVILDIPVVLSDKEWSTVNAIVQTAGTAIPVPCGGLTTDKAFDARRYRDKYGVRYTDESFISEIARNFYAVETKLEEERIQEAAYDYD